jgi:hydroxymethylpyrimidine/phosphomethylpyrimidine kinase
MARQPPVVLSIAGSDPSGGAGIQADLKTFAAFGVYGAAVITALTAQNTCGVTGVEGVSPDFIVAQLTAVLDDLPVAAIKTGMLADARTVAAVAEVLRPRRIPLVVDPVMVATSGDRLVGDDAVDAMRRELFPLADLVTPNLPEAAALLGEAPAGDFAAMERQSAALLAFGCGSALVKGGHRLGDEAVDVLATAVGEVVSLRARRVETANAHGTGCTLSAAIAAGLASGKPLREAVENAKNFVTAALVQAAGWTIGGGHGPINHFALRTPARDA